QNAGGEAHKEYWIPAEDLAEFNAKIRGNIEVIARFEGRRQNPDSWNHHARPIRRTKMDTQELHDRGLKLRRDLFGAAAVESRVAALGEFGAPLQQIINAYAYGDVWSRPGLPMATRSLAMIAMMAAAGKPAELRVHLKGALKNGCTAEEIRE